MDAKINQIRQIAKAMGYQLHRRWQIKTAHYTITNSRLGGWKEMVLDIRDGREMYCGKFPEGLLDAVIAELNEIK